MKRIIPALIVALALLVTPVIAVAESPPAEGASITVLGYGTASAAPDSVRARLHVSVEPTYGPGGPELSFVDLADMEIVRDALVEHGVDADDIEINPFSSSYRYGPSGQAGEFSFVYSDVAGLREFLDSVLEYLDDNKGPKINAATFVFLVENCEELEAQAMQAAYDDARARAGTMAAIVGKRPGEVISMSEDLSSRGANAPVEGCITLDMMDGGGGNLVYHAISSSAGLDNSMLKVEVGILLKATFTLESGE
ncbi:MAG: SIMPL domain-containing protein [Caldilineaceae bacterium]|nr:SIMPL domain-containing protein [Caldilineaceae bacterium]